ncbi:MAG: tryptophan 2,3-dioxygenase family protein [Pseudomonadota bacterium]
MAKTPAPLTYGKYLKLSRLLGSQERKSEAAGQPAHDEMLFIIVHQAYELWFKQILFELDQVQAQFAHPKLDDAGLDRAVHLLGRVVEIEKLLIRQLDILETMTPLDFLEFRDLLVPASGFQSLQFRLIENRLGLRRQDRLLPGQQPYDARLPAADRAAIAAAEATPSLSDQVEAWLKRMPFIELRSYRFGEVYRDAVERMLENEAELVRANKAIKAEERDAELGQLAAARARFESIFDPKRHQALREAGEWRLSWQALQAALFINLYRHEPILQMPFRLLNALMDLDEQLATWRYRHVLMVQRMIGRKVGTGGSSGHDYLGRAAEQHRIFGDLFALSTYFIPRSQLPGLPPEVRAAMSRGPARARS